MQRETKWCDWYGCKIEVAKQDGTEEICNFYGHCDSCIKNIEIVNPEILQEVD